jgi:formylglycine-generating enzyme required for sulfatase activity
MDRGIAVAWALSAVLAVGLAAFVGWRLLAPSPQPSAEPERPRVPGPAGMAWVPGGDFWMGTDEERSFGAERPAHVVRLRGFWMDETEVTNRQYRAFVEATGYVTVAEKPVDWEEMKKQVPAGTPKPADDALRAGAVVFTPPDHAVPLEDASAWWRYVPGANWRHPDGPQSDLAGRDEHPVVHVAWEDANAYAAWAKKRLPTEAEWERAARGGLDRKRFAWGDDEPSDERPPCNIWQGEFPWRNARGDGFERTAPVRSFAANAYGLFDLAGNVWEWCADRYRADAFAERAGEACHVPWVDPKGPSSSWDPDAPLAQGRVIRGGSYLCHRSYCEAYRPSARRGLEPDTGMGHLGFRCVVSEPDRAAR